MNCKQQLGATATATATAPARFRSRVEEQDTPLYEAGYRYLEAQSIETPVISESVAEFTNWCHSVGLTHPHTIDDCAIRGFRMYADASSGVVFEIRRFLQHTHTPKIQYHPAFRVEEFLDQEMMSLHPEADRRRLSALVAYCEAQGITRIETGSEPVFEGDTLREWMESDWITTEKLQYRLYSPIFERFRSWVEQTAADTQGDA